MLTGVSGRPGAARAGRGARELPPRTGIAVAVLLGPTAMLVSQERVIVRSVQYRRGHGLSAYLWEQNGQWLNSRANDVTFLVATAPGPHPASSVTPAEAIAQFGRPYQLYHYQGYVIMVWRNNLLRELGRSSVTG